MLRDRAVLEDAHYYGQLADGFWLIAHPDDPAMRAFLIDDEGMDPSYAGAVVAKMRELAAAEPPDS